MYCSGHEFSVSLALLTSVFQLSFASSVLTSVSGTQFQNVSDNNESRLIVGTLVFGFICPFNDASFDRAVRCCSYGTLCNVCL